MNFVQIAEFDWLPWQQRVNFRKILKNLLLRSRKGDEAETLHTCSWHQPLHKLCFYYAFVALATSGFHILIMGKVEIGICFCVTADILKKLYRNVSGVVLYQPYVVQIADFDWLPATERLNYRKKC